jgi:hypothetical protein
MTSHSFILKTRESRVADKCGPEISTIILISLKVSK